MQLIKKIMLLFLLTAIFGLLGSVRCSGQTISPATVLKSSENLVQQDSETLKALEIANIRLSAALEQNKLLNDRLTAKDSIISAKDALLDIKDQQLKLALDANKDRAGAITIDQVRVEACQAQLQLADKRINQLEHPGFFKQLFSPQTLSGIVIGYGAGRLTK